MIGYEISVRCICGNENTYILNALRYPVVLWGDCKKAISAARILGCALMTNGACPVKCCTFL